MAFRVLLSIYAVRLALEIAGLGQSLLRLFDLILGPLRLMGSRGRLRGSWTSCLVGLTAGACCMVELVSA